MLMWLILVDFILAFGPNIVIKKERKQYTFTILLIFKVKTTRSPKPVHRPYVRRPRI